MLSNKEIESLIDSLKAAPSMSLYESLYARSKESPVFQGKSASRVYTDLFLKIEVVVLKSFMRSKAVEARELPFTSLYSISEMIAFVVPHSAELLVEVMRPDYLDHFFPCHLLNVAILCITLGFQLKFKPHEIVDLGVAALLHDVGMILTDPATFFHERLFSQEEREIVEKHPVVGYEFLEKIRKDFPWLLQVVLEEHRRENDSGYPKDVSGELHPFSKIVGLCDAFEALTHRRHHRLPHHPADAMKVIVRARGREYSPALIKTLIEAVSLYPVGSFVSLNNEKVAKVVGTVPGNPLRPDVRLVGMGPTDSKIVKLSKETNLYIAGIVHDENYQTPETE